MESNTHTNSLEDLENNIYNIDIIVLYTKYNAVERTEKNKLQVTNNIIEKETLLEYIKTKTNHTHKLEYILYFYLNKDIDDLSDIDNLDDLSTMQTIKTIKTMKTIKTIDFNSSKFNKFNSLIIILEYIPKKIYIKQPLSIQNHKPKNKTKKQK